MLFLEKQWKMWKNYRDIKLVTTDKKRNRLVSESNYHTSKYFSEHFMAIKMKRTKVKINKPVYLDMSILDISNKKMYKFWYDYIKPNMETEQNYVTWILIAFLFILKLKIFIRILLMMLKDGLIHLSSMKMIKNLYQ